MKPRRIAIDGAAGAGKSTVGELLAERLGYLYVDTGAMYRAVAWLALQEDVDLHDGAALAELARQSEIVISRPTVSDGRQYTVYVNDVDVTWAIRDTQVTRAVSLVARHQAVRKLLISGQRAMAQREGVVMVGRDIGTVVLPDAELKIFLSAGSLERAKRRYRELVARLGEHHPELSSLEDVHHDIRRRDALDSANMQPADDAIELVTDNLAVPQVLDAIYVLMEERVLVPGT
jgi:cytidylate kinase